MQCCLILPKKGCDIMEKILEVRGLTKLYTTNTGVIDIDFDIFKGDVYGFLGPNGAGKTTVMKIITGLIRANKGTVKIFGYDHQQQFEKAMQKVGTIIETPEAYHYMSGYQNLKLAARFYQDIGEKRIEEVLELVGLDNFKNEKVENYSLGMKQRLGIANAILSKPDLLILDEPTNGLDIEGTVEIRNLIQTLTKESETTFFISSHLSREIELICNRVGIIHQGKIIKEGLVDDILKGEQSSLETFFIKLMQENRGEK